MSINGLTYISDYLDSASEQELLDTIDAQPWLDDLKRRVQHYGYKYDYRARAIDSSMFLGPLPDWAAALAEELHSRGIYPQMADQLIVNEYHPGQGIAAHVDCEPCFDGTIASITLGSGCTMDFTHVGDNSKYSQYLEPRSIVVLTGEARYDWRHAIAPRKSDIHNDLKIERGRRVSLTFRNVLFDQNAKSQPQFSASD